MRELRELYQVVLDRYKKQVSDRVHSGLCDAMCKALTEELLTGHEYDFVRSKIYENRPTEDHLSQFYDKERYEYYKTDPSWWWGFSNTSERIDFMKYLIRNE